MRSPRQRVAAVSAVDVNAKVCMRVREFFPRVFLRCRASDHLVVPAVRMHEAPAAFRRGLDADLSLVHQAMV